MPGECPIVSHACRGNVPSYRVRCQVIVKLSNIVLTPQHPKYKGGAWRVEGVHNEHIVAVGVYHYDASNISQSLIHFRQTIDGDAFNECDDECVRDVFGLVLRGGRSIQLLGTVAAKSDRCIAFPNALWQRAAPFRLLDPKRGGVLRSLVFLLVDPSVRIASTADVPPQQPQWLEREMLSVSSVCGLRCLPEVLVREVMAYVGDGVALQEARTHRKRLVDERRAIGREVTSRVFQIPLRMFELGDDEDEDIGDDYEYADDWRVHET